MKSRLPSHNFHLRRHSRWRLLILLPLLESFGMLAGCAPRTVVKTDFCTPWQPILVGGADVLTDATAKAILTHDQTGVKLGCWKAPAAK